MQKPSIIVTDLHVSIQDTTVLNGISFSLQPNQHLAVLGTSGSGKSTLAQAFAGKIHFSGSIMTPLNPTGPQITLIERRDSFKNLSGISEFYYQQRFNSFDAEDAPTIMQELLKGLQAGENELNEVAKIESGLKRLGIFHLKNSPLIQLSSGEHKRFQLIKALLNPPVIIDS